MFGIDLTDLVGPVFDRFFGGAKEKYNEEVAKYNREVDITTLQLALRRFGHEQALNSQGILDAQFRAGVAQRGIIQATDEAATEQLRRTYLRDLSNSEAQRTEYLARGRFNVARNQKRTRMSELRMQASVDQATRNVLFAQESREDRLFNAASIVRQQRRAQMDVLDDVARQVFGAGSRTRDAARTALGVEATAAEDVLLAGEGTRGARARRLAVGEAAQRQTMQAERGVLGARGQAVSAERRALLETTGTSLAAVAAQRTAVRGASAITRGTLMEQRQEAVGAAQAGAAARGLAVTSSAATVGQAEAQTAHRRELALQQMEERVQMAGLARQESEIRGRALTGQARVGQAFTELHRDAAVLQRRDVEYRADVGVSRAELGEAGVRARSEYAVSGARRTARGAELEEADVRARGTYEARMAQSAVDRAGLAYEGIDSETARLVSRMQRERSRIELTGRETVRGRQMEIVRSQFGLETMTRDAQLEEAAMRRRRGLVEVAESQDREGAIQIRALDAEVRRRRELMTEDELQRDNDMIALEQQFAEWQLERLPDLPSGAGARNERFIRDVLTNMGRR